MPLRIGIGSVLNIVFSLVGIYLVAIRHNSARYSSNKFYLFAILYAAWSLGLILWRGDAFEQNRQVGYSLLFGLSAFAGSGMILIRDPLRFYVIGSRIGVILSAIICGILTIRFEQRLGMGGNAAVFAFIMAISSIGASIPIKKFNKYLPNGPYYLFFGFLAVMMTETRAIILILPLFLLSEIIIFSGHFPTRAKIRLYGLLLAVIIATVLFPPIQRVISERFVMAFDYYTGQTSDLNTKASVSIRLLMWSGALEVIRENPLTGVGSIAKMSAVSAKLGEDGKALDGFLHVHNFILDELLSNGAIGLLLMILTGVFGIRFIWHGLDNFGIRRNLIYFVITVFAYGFFHSTFLHESTITSVFLFMGVLNAATVRSMKA